MKLSNIKPLSQKDKRWANLKLPGGGSLGRYGCLLTVLSMVLNTTPDKLLKENIFNNNYIDWSKFVKKFKFSFQWLKSGDFERICRERADRGLPTIIRIANFEHFVLCVGYDNNSKELFINDPLFGETYYLKAKKYRIKSLRLLTPIGQPEPPQTGSNDALKECLKQHQKLMGIIAKNDKEKEELRKEIEILQKRLQNSESIRKDLAKQSEEFSQKLATETKKASSLSNLNAKLLRENKELKKTVEKLEKEKSDYKRYYEKALERVISKATVFKLIMEIVKRFTPSRK